MKFTDYVLKRGLSVEQIKIDKTFKASFEIDSDINKLKESIERFGQVEPVDVLKIGNELVLIHGFKRFFALKKMGEGLIDAFLHQNITTPEEGIALYLLKNQKRDLNPVEIGNILRFYNRNIHLNELIEEAVDASVKMKVNNQLLKRMEFLTSLPDSLKRLFLTTGISISECDYLKIFDLYVVKSILNLFSKVHFSKGARKNFYTLLMDAIYGRKIAAAKLFDSLNQEELNSEKMVIEYLEGVVRPFKVKTKKDVFALKKELPPRVNVLLDETFESLSGKLLIKFSFDNVDKLKETIKDEKIISVLKGMAKFFE